MAQFVLSLSAGIKPYDVKRGAMTTPHKTGDMTVSRDSLSDKRMASVKHNIIFISSKSGVGKTIVAVNLAITLSKMNSRVGLVDLNLNNPDVHRFTGVEIDLYDETDAELTPVPYSDQLKVMSVASVIDEACIEPCFPDAFDVRSFICGIKWGRLDYLLFDTPAGPAEDLRAVIKAIPNAGAIIVTAPDMIDPESSEKMIHFIRSEDILVIGWIENMRGYLCQNCDLRQETITTGPASRAVFLNDIPFLGRIPIDINLESSVNVDGLMMDTCSNFHDTEPYCMIARKIMAHHASGRTLTKR